MKRDMDLIRTILLTLEESEGQPDLSVLASEGHAEKQLSYHCWLLLTAGLASGRCHEPDLEGNRFVVLDDLTWDGHEFLDAARDDATWKRAKEEALSATGSTAFEFVKMIVFELGRKAVMAQLGMPA